LTGPADFLPVRRAHTAISTLCHAFAAFFFGRWSTSQSSGTGVALKAQAF
jgi:hypothetical protein